MTTLEDIAFTFVGGSVVGVVSVCAFGCAVRSRSTAIALRAEARPKETIYTAHPVSASQQRGSPMLGWIPWTLSLSYDTMLNGIPGTGTREKGLSGLMLNVNLDGIVLLRFQAICLRVCGTATALFVMIAIPAYLSAQCYTRTEDNGQGCGGNEYNLTNYERTTLANVPTIYGTFSNSTDSSLPGGGGGHASSPLRTVVHANHGILWRLYAVVFCFWIVAIHLCRLLHAEWVQILAMRRVYYLEYDIWGSRREELHKTIYCDADETDAGGGSGDADKTAERGGPSQDDDFDDLFTGHDDNDGQGSLPAGTATKRVAFDSARTKPLKSASAMAESNGNDGSVGGVDIRKKEPHLYRREPWIPHPEQRDTVPHVAVYSILVGGLPSLPGQAADSFNADTTLQFSKRESIDWQLSLTTTFFDHCVPNQPGFSSSIAAVTIIPGALDLSVAWRKWYAAAAKLRRLRFLRDQIQKRRYFDIEAASSEEKAAHIDVDIYGYGDSNDSGYGDSAKNNDDRDSAKDYGYGDPSEKDYEYGSRNSDNDEVYVPANASESEVASYLANGKNAVHNFDMGGAKTKLFHQKALKAATGGESDTHIYDSMEFGPEQAAVYAREFALAAAPCCPNGCNEGRIRRAPIEELVELERIASIEVHQANLELREARRRATRTDTFTAMRNLHDQQSGQESKVARVVGASMNAASANSGISGATVMPKFVPPKTVVEEDIYNDDSLDAAELAEAIQNLPMISRYDRRGSANNDDANIQKFDRPSTQQIAERLELAVPSDLDLEAQLFKKATDDRSHLPVKKDNNSNKTMRQLMKGSEFKAAVSRRRVPNKTGMPQIPNKTGMPQCIPETEGFEHDSNASLPFNFIKKATGNESIRRRKPNIGAPVTENPVSSKDKEMHCADNSSSAQWAQVETLITEANESTPTPRTLTGGQRDCANGTWQGVSSGWMFSRTKVKPNNIKTWAKKQSKEAVSSLARESTYAVVTFTSRQAAVAARACLADGRGAGRWSTLKDMPIPPLSDAAPGDVITFRNCCRPVTLSR